MKIPTAEEFLNNFGADADDMFYASSVKEAMIEFAKLHVKACKEDCLNDSETFMDGSSEFEEFKQSILNSYPETNIQ